MVCFVFDQFCVLQLLTTHKKNVGDLPLEQQLKQIDECISEFDRIDPKTEVPIEKRFIVIQ
jgi:hypothetical protein